MIALALTVALGWSGVDLRDAVTRLDPDIAFLPRERAVSNWRTEAARHLDASWGTAANLLLGRDPAAITRCVRLNNYWCIKRAGWSGEIAADRDGHVAFASAAEGATVAALLLRRYYVDYGRRSALAIVSHWAPSSCGAAPGVMARSAAHPTGADDLATRGIGRTLRARWLVGHGRRIAAGMRRSMRRSVVPDRLIGHRETPSPVIALGLGDGPVSLAATLPSTLAARWTALSAAPWPAPACHADTARIRNYAIRAAAGLVRGIDDDLGIFDATGRPTPRLARLMHNMSAVEIGPLGAGPPLIERAIAHAVEVVAARAVAEIDSDRDRGRTGGPRSGGLDEGRPAGPRP